MLLALRLSPEDEAEVGAQLRGCDRYVLQSETWSPQPCYLPSLGLELLYRNCFSPHTPHPLPIATPGLQFFLARLLGLSALAWRTAPALTPSSSTPIAEAPTFQNHHISPSTQVNSGFISSILRIHVHPPRSRGVWLLKSEAAVWGSGALTRIGGRKEESR